MRESPFLGMASELVKKNYQLKIYDTNINSNLLRRELFRVNESLPDYRDISITLEEVFEHTLDLIINSNAELELDAIQHNAN